RVTTPDHQRLLELFEDFGFRRYADEQRALSNEARMKGAGEHERRWQVIRTSSEFESFLALLQQKHRFAVDLETTSVNPMEAEIVGWAFCWEADEGCYIPVAGPEGETFLDCRTVLAALKPILEDPDREIINQNVKYDMVVLKRAEVEIRGVG